MNATIESLSTGARRLSYLLLICCTGCAGEQPGQRPHAGAPSSSSSSETATGMSGVLLEHLARYPEMEIEDLYKLVYQAAGGSAHALRDSLAARQQFEGEIRQLSSESSSGDGAAPGQPLTERITPDGKLVRVNLRPYLAAGGDIESLWKAFVRTGRERVPSLDSLRAWWSEAEALAERGRLAFPKEALHSHYVRQAVRGFPTAHHSSHFEELYRPAYRVVAEDALRLPRR